MTTAGRPKRPSRRDYERALAAVTGALARNPDAPYADLYVSRSAMRAIRVALEAKLAGR